jgi:hypothetical protein
MNPVVRLVVSALWAVAYVLFEVVADYCRVVADSRVSASPATIPASPTSIQLRNWLARRLTSPPAAPRLGTT